MWGYERHKITYSLEQCPPASIKKEGQPVRNEFDSLKAKLLN